MRQRRLKNEINVVPYIDVMLVLLIIFMVSAPLITSGQIDLPSVGQQLNPTVAPLEVRLDKNGAITLIDSQSGGSERRVSQADLLSTGVSLFLPWIACNSCSCVSVSP